MMDVGGFLRDFEPFRTAQGELLLRYPRILETRVIINRPSDVAVADPRCRADSADNCVQSRGNPLMGACRRGHQTSSALQFGVLLALW